MDSLAALYHITPESLSLRRRVTLNVSAKGMKVIDVRGIDSVVRDILARGEKI